MNIEYTLFLICLALIAIGIWQREAIARLLGAGRGRERLLGAKKADDLPGLFQSAVDDAARRLHRAKEALESCRTLLDGIQGQVESGEREKTRLESRIQAALAEGEQDKAKQYAPQLAEVEGRLAANRKQLAEHQATYDNFAQQVEAAQQQILETRRKAEGLGVALEQSEQEKELAQFAADLKSGELAQRVAPAEEQIQQQIDQNRAVGRVAGDLGS